VAANLRPLARVCLCLRVPGQNGQSDLVTHHQSLTIQLPLREALEQRRDLVTQPPFGSATALTRLATQRLRTIPLALTIIRAWNKMLSAMAALPARRRSHGGQKAATLATSDARRAPWRLGTKLKLNKTARVLVSPRLLQFAICYSRSALLARLLNSLNSFTKRQAAEDAPARSPRLRETSTRSAIPGRLRFVECLRL
jgi:hypothetical protein